MKRLKIKVLSLENGKNLVDGIGRRYRRNGRRIGLKK
jgi:hypothetical protein